MQQNSRLNKSITLLLSVYHYLADALANSTLQTSCSSSNTSVSNTNIGKHPTNLVPLKIHISSTNKCTVIFMESLQQKLYSQYNCCI